MQKKKKKSPVKLSLGRPHTQSRLPLEWKKKIRKMYQFTALCQLRMYSTLQCQTCAQTCLPTKTTEEDTCYTNRAAEEVQRHRFQHLPCGEKQHNSRNHIHHSESTQNLIRSRSKQPHSFKPEWICFVRWTGNEWLRLKRNTMGVKSFHFSSVT